VSVVVVTPVPVFVAVMVTPGISAPAGSDTLPPKLPFCENPKLAMSKPNKTAPKTFLRIRVPRFYQMARIWVARYINVGMESKGKRQKAINAVPM
jgi:hypothetical protein